jgi:DNA-binding NtrC family response regulator/Flp pilus assembly protein TadD
MRNSVTTGRAFPEVAIHYVESLHNRRDFAAVVNYYENTRSQLEELGGAKAGNLLRLIASAYASLDNHSAALKTARLAQKNASEDNDSILLGEIFVLIGGSLVQLGEFREAEKAYRDAESIFRRNDCPDGQCRALNLLSGLFFKRNDFKNSLATLTDAMTIAKKSDDTTKIAYMMGNLGRIKTFLSDFAGAISHLQLNIDLSTELGDWLEVGRAYLSLGYVQMQCGEYQRAEESLNRGLEFLEKTGSQRDMTTYKIYMGELYRRTGRMDQSESILKEAVRIAEETVPDSLVHGRALRQLAELYVALKSMVTASRLVAKAMSIMQRIDNKVENGALDKLKAVIADYKGETELCNNHFNRAFELLTESGVRFEKADALIAAGKCASYDERRRLMFLFRAEEFFAGNRFNTRLDEIGSLIETISEFDSEAVGAKERGNVAFGTDCEFLTLSPDIKRFLNQLPVIGRMDLPILLLGETGVGKDHLARYYQCQVRPGSPFIAINCASVPETLLESELFGHKRGAFTGAENDKPGLFSAANGGVLFLDEIGDMPLSLQAKLLGVLERKKVIPLGSTKEIELDVKLVAASNRDLETMVEQGKFRRDLFYRLSGMTYRIAPLRERKEDIPLLLEQFMKNASLLDENQNVPTEMLKHFLEYDWPGNVRELQNKVKKLQVMLEMVAEGDMVELSRSLLAAGTDSKDDSLTNRVEEFERQLILEALLAAGGNKSRAARMLGIHEATVRTKLKRYGISLAG